MLGNYLDRANLCTLVGMALGFFSVLASANALAGLSLSLMLAGVLCDIFDGTIARATKNRKKELWEFGGQLDSLADLVHSGVAPAAFLAMATDYSPLGLVAAAVVIIAAVTRLAYYNVHGLDGSFFVGMPVFYCPIILAAFYPLLAGISLPWTPSLLALSVLVFIAETSRLRIPKFTGFRYWIVVLLTAALCMFHALS